MGTYPAAAARRALRAPCKKDPVTTTPNRTCAPLFEYLAPRGKRISTLTYLWNSHRAPAGFRFLFFSDSRFRLYGHRQTQKKTPTLKNRVL